jgi:hypothetical protein
MGRNLGWKIIGARSVGSSHLLNDEPCQDYYLVGTLLAEDGNEVFYSFVSDGAGSALMGKEGSKMACEASLEYLKSIDYKVFEERNIYELVEHITTSISKLATSENLESRDFACTLLGVVVTDNSTSYFQVGDGAIVVKENINNSNYNVVFWPANGEYANMTYFVTDENVIANLMVKHVFQSPVAVSIFTDGLQRLCLQYETSTVHEPFFKSMFATLMASNKDEDIPHLNSKLLKFLDGPKVNERTDDDKTLILAIRIKDEE